ncbi:MAG: hypothetical protein Q8922_11510 [Bacteroidota bacterium]|nr:hypothetical protein [Bacteroidota bacterium]MDP4233625.1 hypothetical protein [Bacteroidota bacterium]MDP4243115.1 hypothetical protein [Bacteroidota bacterium]MDP4288553.1 hypothetical protein [Bacteroidota bacterium]
MANPETAATVRPAKVATKPLVAHKTKKPSAMPVFLLSIVGGLAVHLLFCLALQGLGDGIRWHPFGIDSDVHFGEQQFFVQPPLAFIPFDILFGFIFATAVGFIIRLPFFRDRVYHTLMEIKKRLQLQLSASAEEVESILRNDPENTARVLARRTDINLDSVQLEIGAINGATAYLAGKGSWLSGIGTYMRFHFTEEYSNMVTGMAYGGAAFLIFVVGIRGLKFIPATKPSFILFALGIEFSMLTLLAITMVFTVEEERTDRILRQMVDAVKGPKKALAEPEPVPELQLTRGDYERIVREQMDKQIVKVLSDKDDDAMRRLALDLVAKG